MENLLRRWKLLALRYKRESASLNAKITEVLITMNKNEIEKLNLGMILILNHGTMMNVCLDKILTKYESIVLDSHDTLEDVISGIFEDEEMVAGESDSDGIVEQSGENLTTMLQDDDDDDPASNE